LSRYFRARVTENRTLNRNHNLLSLENLDVMEEPAPGQFYMLGVTRGYDPLLKRAFSLFRRTPGGFQVLYRIKGKGTAILGSLKEGSVIDVLGPLGNGYPLPSDERVPIIVAGGIGIASVFPLIERLKKRAYVFYGARMEDELFLVDEIRGISRELFVCTDDGSCGTRGTVVDILRDIAGSEPKLQASPVIYACGPKPVLEMISKISAERNIEAYVSLEEHMACGIGACLGCVVRTKGQGEKKGEGAGVKGHKKEDSSFILHPSSSYKRVCKEGPVFDSREIEW
jgi:dihydroorotate dehydrogenase electron transfer subunit